MVTISLASPFSPCTGEKKLLMSLIPDPVCFSLLLCFFFLHEGCSGRLFQLLLGSLDRVQETNLKSVLLWARCSIATSCLYLSITG